MLYVQHRADCVCVVLTLSLNKIDTVVLPNFKALKKNQFCKLLCIAANYKKELNNISLKY